MSAIRPEIFEQAAERIFSGTRFTCWALEEIKATSKEIDLWADFHRLEGESMICPWFSNFYASENKILRETLLREAAFNLRNYGYE